MAGSENFNDGASLASKGWTNVVNAANVAGAGPDGSYALQATSALGNGTMPMVPCSHSTRLMVTVDWNKVSTDYIAFMLHSTGYNPSGHGGTTDDWIINFTHSGTSGQVMTNGAGGVNVWNIPSFYPVTGSGWKVWRFEIQFSSGVMTPGNDGTLYFGIYPGTRDESPGLDPGPTLDGVLRVWSGNDISSLVLRYELTDLGLLNPILIGAALPYDSLQIGPEGTIDNIVWDDYCATTTLPEATIVTSQPPVCCDPDQINKHVSVGVLSPTVDPTWYPQCAGFGAVPEAPDVIDPESWIS